MAQDLCMRDLSSSLPTPPLPPRHNDMVNVAANAPTQHGAVHKVFLIRHGETVDNVAGLYVGVRDSALTSHGVQQTIRLGQYFARQELSFTHIFSSDLSRALKTAEAVRHAQNAANGQEVPVVVRNADLREQDFGYYEGRPFFARKKEPSTSAKQDHLQEHKSDPGFVSIETKDSLFRRADKFLNEHLLPILAESAGQSHFIAVVSHGMLLSALWKCILKRQPPKSITIESEAPAGRPIFSLEHLGGWSNTGYLELHLSPVDGDTTTRNAIDKVAINRTDSSLHHPRDGSDQQVSETATDNKEDREARLSRVVELTEPSTSAEVDSAPFASRHHETETGSNDNKDVSTALTPDSESSQMAGRLPYSSNFLVTIARVNCLKHLETLKRTRGGVGSSKHDEGQRSIDSFFKKPRVD